MREWHRDSEAGHEPGERPLRALDPERVEPGYWARLHRRIMEAAAPELARRSALHDVTLDEVMSSWARTVVPTALLAAAVAGFLVLQDAARPDVAVARSADVEEALLEGLEDSGFSAVASGRDGDAGSVIFAVESF